jgi:hypothetical protein
MCSFQLELTFHGPFESPTQEPKLILALSDNFSKWIVAKVVACGSDQVTRSELSK